MSQPKPAHGTTPPGAETEAQAAGYVYRAPDGTLEFTDTEKSDPDYQLLRRVDLDDRSSLTVVSELPSWVKLRRATQSRSLTQRQSYSFRPQ